MQIKVAKNPLELSTTLFMWSIATLLLAAILILFYQMIGPGLSTINWSYLISEPMNSGRAGGLFPILISTLLILGVSLLFSIPLGIATAVFLSEFTSKDNWLSQQVRRSLDILAGVPSIVFGLFGNALFCKYLGLGFSILSGGLTLACMILPILIRSTEIGLRSVPQHLRLSGLALALSKKTLLFQVTLPYAAPGIAVGLVLGIGRALAETAALIFTSGYVDRMPSSLMDSGRSLSIHIYDLSMNVPGGEPNAYRSTFVIMMMLLVLNTLAMILTDLFLARKVQRQ